MAPKERNTNPRFKMEEAKLNKNAPVKKAYEGWISARAAYGRDKKNRGILDTARDTLHNSLDPFIRKATDSSGTLLVPEGKWWKFEKHEKGIVIEVLNEPPNIGGLPSIDPF